MKNLAKMVLSALVIFITACSSDDNEPVKEPSAKFEVINNVVQNIPDAVSGTIPGVVTSVVAVDNEGIIADASKINIKLELQHAWAGDLVVQVFDPSGASCTLIKRLGETTFGSNRDFLLGNVIVFNSAASMSINDAVLTGDATTVPAGTYLPGKGTVVIPEAVVMTDLATFLNGKSIKGQWQLRVSDYTTGDIGKLNNCKLEFDTGALQ